MTMTEHTLTDGTPPITLGDLIYKARKMAGLTIQELALKSGISRNSLSAWEDDVRSPRPYMLDAIADATEQTWLRRYSHLCAGHPKRRSQIRCFAPVAA